MAPHEKRLKPSWVMRVLLAMVILVFILPGLGFIYWHVHVSRCIRSLRASPQDARLILDLGKAKSRALPQLMSELRRAVAGRELQWAGQVTVYIDHVVSESEDTSREGGPSGRISPYAHGDSDSVNLQKSRAIEDWWETDRGLYPPRWMFWQALRAER
jgi:hypothetical protein